MMNKILRSKFISLLIILTQMSCVSVEIKQPENVKSEVIQYSEPEHGFTELESDYLDKAWQNKATGSTISFLSDCNNPTDPTLENLFKGITSEIDKVNVIESHKINYNAREALHSKVDGLVDGVLTRFELIVFKKNNCTYVLTYAAEARAFQTGQRVFAKFVKGFVVP